MKIGYRARDYVEYGIKNPINIVLPKKTSNILVAGKSGSGKSLSLIWYLYNMLHTRESLVYIADYKAGEEYSEFEGAEAYASGAKAVTLIEDFYQLFTTVREGRIRLGRHYTLVIEEYSGLLSWIESVDKKMKSRIMSEVGELLAVARGLNLGVLLAVQRADAALFSMGSREQFQCVLSFGRCSQEQFRMLGFAGELDENPTGSYGAGRALALIDGQETVQEVVVPLITNPEQMRSYIRSKLMLQPSLQALARAIAEGKNEGCD